jgi:hypothetical protein
VIVLAVKPQSMREVAAQLLPFIDAARQPLCIDCGRHPQRRLVALAGRLWRHRALHAEHAGADRHGHHRHGGHGRREPGAAQAAGDILRASARPCGWTMKTRSMR